MWVAHLDDVMRKYITNKECCRKFISYYLGFVHDDMKVPIHLCCDNCNYMYDEVIDEVEDMAPTSTMEPTETAGYCNAIQIFQSRKWDNC